MRIGTNLIEFEESSEMKFFFELESPESKPSSLFIILDDRVLACIEIVRGTMDDGIDIMLEESIEAEVNSLGGYISKLHEDFPDDISAKFTFNDKEVNQYHIFKYGKVSFDEKDDQGYLHFDYNVLQSTVMKPKKLEKNEDFKDCIGNLLVEIISNRLMESIDESGTTDIEESDL